MANFTLAIDSGAHSWFENFIKHESDKAFRTNKHLDYSVVRSRFYKSFLDSYIGYLHEVGNTFEFYVSLDVLGHPKYSWDILKYMESNGLKPIPVFHLFEDFSWLSKMVDNYEYIGVGVVNKGSLAAPFEGWIKKVFEEYIQNKDGTPRVKVHGFAANALDILKQYPFYSCDASTWSFGARLGHVQIPDPIIKNNEVVGWDFFPHFIKSVALTERRQGDSCHYLRLSESNRAIMRQYFDFLEADLDLLMTEYSERDYANARFFTEAEVELKKFYKNKFNFEEGGNIYLAGTASSSSSSTIRLNELIERILEKAPNLRFLLSVWYKNYASMSMASHQYVHHGSGDEPRDAFLEKLKKEISNNVNRAAKDACDNLYDNPHLQDLTLEELNKSVKSKSDFIAARQEADPVMFFTEPKELKKESRFPNIRRRGDPQPKPVEEAKPAVDAEISATTEPPTVSVVEETVKEVFIKASPVIMLKDLELKIPESMTVKELNTAVEKAVEQFLGINDTKFKLLSISLEEHINNDGE